MVILGVASSMGAPPYMHPSTADCPAHRWKARCPGGANYAVGLRDASRLPRDAAGAINAAYGRVDLRHDTDGAQQRRDAPARPAPARHPDRVFPAVTPILPGSGGCRME